MILYCSHCGGKTEYSATKPNFCSFCSEPFVKKGAVAARPVAKQVPGQKSVAERVQEMEEAQDEIPISFDVHTVGSVTPKAGQRIMVDEAFVKSVPSFDRGMDGGGTGFGEADAQLSKAKNEIIDRMINPKTPVR
jgi:hypothetical protein